MLPPWLTVALVLLREMARALAFPLRIVLYLPRQRYWEARARAALATPPRPPSDETLRRFLRRRRPLRGARPHVLLSAGEASGELHATRVMDEVARSGLDVRWSCFGGPSMQSRGGALLAPLSEHAIMGVSGVLRALPLLLRTVATFVRVLRDDPPDLVVLVDYPGLHLVLGKLARSRGVPVLHYIAPQYWAWAPWRMRRYLGCVDATLAILPFEAAFFEREGLLCEYVGHPLLDHFAAHPPARAELEAVRARPTVCLLPGSRRSEIETNLPAFAAIVRRLHRDHPELRFVVPHTDERRAPLIRAILRREGADEIEFHPGPLAKWLQGARVVVAKSGTGSLEACLHGAPTIVVYQLKGWLAEQAFARYLTVPWIASANLIAGRQVVPEIVFRGAGGWKRVEDELRALLADGPARAALLEGVAEVRARMGQPGASARAARWIVAFCTPEQREVAQPATKRATS